MTSEFKWLGEAWSNLTAWESLFHFGQLSWALDVCWISSVWQGSVFLMGDIQKGKTTVPAGSCDHRQFALWSLGGIFWKRPTGQKQAEQTAGGGIGFAGRWPEPSGEKVSHHQFSGPVVRSTAYRLSIVSSHQTCSWTYVYTSHLVKVMLCVTEHISEFLRMDVINKYMVR